MDIKKWIRSVTKEDKSGTIAVKIGVNAGTFKRQYDAGKIPPINLVKIARAYNIPPLSALIACGLITEEEANIDDADIKAIKEALENTKQLAQNAIGLETATDEQLLQELLRRVKQRKVNPIFTEPVTPEA